MEYSPSTSIEGWKLLWAASIPWPVRAVGAAPLRCCRPGEHRSVAAQMLWFVEVIVGALLTPSMKLVT